MTRLFGAWTGGRARCGADRLVSRLPGVAVAVVLLCLSSPAVASAHGGGGAHVARYAMHISTHRAPDLRLGSGEGTPDGWAVVRRLQRGLRRAGYAPGAIDGRYGPLTAAAVARFQANHRLPVDGIVGPATRRALHAAPVLALGAGEASAHGSPVVARLQRMLRRAGFNPGRVDGRFGPRTARAVKAFQRARRLAADGIAGHATVHALAIDLEARSRRASHPRAIRVRPARPRSAPVRPNSPSPQGVRPRPAHPAPGLPGTWLGVGLVVLGLLAVASGYLRTRRRTRPDRSRQPMAPGGRGG